MVTPDAAYSIHKEASRIFRDILLKDERLGLPPKVLQAQGRTSFNASDTIDTPYLPVPFKLSESSAALWGLAATVGNAIARERFGLEQNVVVNTDIASLFLISCALATVDGKSVGDPALAPRLLKYDLGHMSDPYRRLCTNVYKTRDGRFFHLHGSMNADKSLAMIGMPLQNDSLVQQADIVKVYSDKLAEFDAKWLDVEANEYYRQAGTVCLTEDEFKSSEQGTATRTDGLYSIKKVDIGLVPPTPYPAVSEDTSSYRPLEGLRLVDLSRVIAAPTIAKLAALFGATVIRVSCDSQPDMGPLLVDGNLGKRDVSLNIKSEAGRAKLKELISEADIVLDGYRPGALERMGFGVEYIHALGRRRGRGIIVVRENCYGWKGPMSHRSGWQQISDCVTGVAWGMGRFLGLEEPVVPPVPNSDYQTGLAGLIGILAAVDSRGTEGGSYCVDVSLNQYNQFLLSLGQYPPEVQASLRALHPGFSPRHFDDMISLTGKVMGSMLQAVPQLFKPGYFANIESRFDGADSQMESLSYLDAAAKFEVSRLGYDVGSCFPGTYAPEWPAQGNKPGNSGP